MRLLLLAAAVPQSVAPEPRFEAIKKSLFTIEVRSGKAGDKASLGSGYLVSDQGHVVTNYHVVASYIAEPDRYAVWARDAATTQPARLVKFDFVNDLALLQIERFSSAPLTLARQPPSSGSPVIAFGNPHGFGLSLVEGIYNGLAEKGVVDRMLLSMPINAGMSGGPILDRQGHVVGTNVSVIMGENSLSFGVPVSKVTPLLGATPLTSSRQAFLDETRKQLAELETATVARLGDLKKTAETIALGSSAAPRLPGLFECWNSSQVFHQEGITKTWYSCNLHFSPNLEDHGHVGWVEVLIEDTASLGGRWGFYGSLEKRLSEEHEDEIIKPGNSFFSPSECVADRTRAGEIVWSINTCVSAYVKHPGFYNIKLQAMTVSNSHEAIYVVLDVKGFRVESCRQLAESLLGRVRWGKKE